MWYFTWVLGTAFAVCFGILNAMWYDAQSKNCSGNCSNHGSCQK